MKKLEIWICAVTILAFGFLNWINLDSTQLKKTGYTKKEIKLILKTSEKTKDYLKKYYIKNINQLLTNKDFKAEYLKRYHQFYQENEIDFDKVVYLVNHNFDEIDSFVYSEVIFSLLENPYFLYQNTTRYMSYYEKNPEQLEKVVQAVNCNLDYDYYTHVTNAEIKKGHFILVNKYYQLSPTYVPENLVSIDPTYGVGMLEKEAYEAFKKLSDDAKKDGYAIKISSGYRSYQRQQTLYQNYIKKDGEKADTYSARPGFSEHQTGLAIDVQTYKMNKTDYTWIHENCYRYGFILRYPEKEEDITGYMYEPWHFRYVGIDTAKKIKDLSLTYDEYYAYYLNNI